MKVINFSDKKAADVHIIQPTGKISGYTVSITEAIENKFNIKIGCKTILIGKGDILEIIAESDGIISSKTTTVQCIIEDGCRRPTESDIFNKNARILSEETEKYYISEDERIFKKEDPRWLIIPVKVPPRGKWFTVAKGKLYYNNHLLTALDVVKIKKILEVIRNYYYPADPSNTDSKIK